MRDFPAVSFLSTPQDLDDSQKADELCGGLAPLCFEGVLDSVEELGTILSVLLPVESENEILGTHAALWRCRAWMSLHGQMR